ncbi:hypothetical protein BASA60_006059 [Batrachochytrium salamandrivorans]|nr:hypothetical protein BASA60_006059 [Batrachochytrium salamandrivorans]
MLPSSQTLIPPQSCIPAPLCHPSALLAPTHPSTPKPYLFDFFQNQQNQQQPLVNLSDLQLDLSTTMEMLASTISQSIPQPLPKSTHAMSASLEKLDPSQISTCPSLSTSSMVSSPADTVKLDPEDGKIHPLHYTPPTRLDPILETILCQEPDSDRRFSCPFSGCTTRFQRRYNLKCHYATIHVNTEKFPCPDCNYKTARRRELKRHIDKVHSGQPLDRRRGKKRVPSLLQTGSPLSSTASVSTTSVASRTP